MKTSAFILLCVFLWYAAVATAGDKIEVLGTGIVYRNPAPQLRAINALHPTVTRLKDGALLSAFDLGQGPESFDYSSWWARSDDNGKTWTKPAMIVGEPFAFKGRRCNYLLRVRARADGSVFGIGARIYRDFDDEGFVNRANLGYAPLDLVSVRSADGGKTWSAPATINPPLVGPSFEICHPIVELSDGRILAPMGTWKSWNGEAPNGMKAIALVSRDGGRSWPEYLNVMDDYANGVIHFEQSMVQLPDRRLLAVCWAYNEKTEKSGPTPYVLSDADARSFGPRMLTGLKGQTAKMAALKDGRVLMLYRRDDQPGLWANLSKIDGDKWINLAECAVWSGAKSGMEGKTTSAEELSKLKFGAPNLLLLPDGNVFAVFWCVEDGISNIRWTKLACQ